MSETILTDLPQGHIATYSGRVISPLDPDPAQIAIEDIAHALSNQCRFTGHVRTFYSVAEHSVRCVRELIDQNFYFPILEYPDPPEELDLLGWTLLHDASEAYLSDIARPVKQGLGFGGIYREVETRLMEVIATKYRLSWPQPDEVTRVDDVMLRTEQRDLMPKGRLPGDEYATEKIEETWTPTEARDRFLQFADEFLR